MLDGGQETCKKAMITGFYKAEDDFVKDCVLNCKHKILLFNSIGNFSGQTFIISYQNFICLSYL